MCDRKILTKRDNVCVLFLDCSSLVPDVVNNTGALLGVLDSLLQTYEVSTVLTDDGVYDMTF